MSPRDRSVATPYVARMRLVPASIIALCALAVACTDEETPTPPGSPTTEAGTQSAGADTGRDASIAVDASAARLDDGGAPRDARVGSSQNNTPRVVDAGLPSNDPRFAGVKLAPGCPSSPQFEPVSKHSSFVGAMAIVGEQLYFAAGSAGVFAMPKDGSAPPKNVWMKYAQDLAAVSNTIYVRTNIGGFSLTPEQLAAGKDSDSAEVAGDVQAFGDHVYSFEKLVCPEDKEVVIRYDASGKYDARSLPCPVLGAVGSDDVTYATHAGISDSALDGIYEFNFDDEDAPKRIVEELRVGALTVTATHLYFTKHIDDKTDYLLRAPIAGGSAELVAGPFVWRGTVTDGKETYIGDGKTNCVYRVDAAANTLVPVAQLAATAGLAEGAYDAPYLYVAADGQISRLKL